MESDWKARIFTTHFELHGTKKTHVLNLSIVSHFAVIWFYLGNSLLYNECDETGRHEGHTQCKEDGKQKSRKITCDIISLERKKQSEIKNL